MFRSSSNFKLVGDDGPGLNICRSPQSSDDKLAILVEVDPPTLLRLYLLLYILIDLSFLTTQEIEINVFHSFSIDKVPPKKAKGIDPIKNGNNNLKL